MEEEAISDIKKTSLVLIVNKMNSYQRVI